MTEGKTNPVPNFKRVLREVRIAHAERNDVIVELRETEQMRLQLLAEALDGVFKDLPDDYEQLLLGLLPGQPPRYWVDATSFVMMGRDKRQYQFVKDTRLGRAVLAESMSVETIAQAVTRYVAERIVERDQAIDADWLNAAIRSGSAALPGARPAPAPSGDNVALVWAIAGFGLGMIAGMVLLVAYAWFTVG